MGAVVLNRVEHPSFPDTIAGVVYQPGAFTAITDGQINEEVYESSKRAAKEALNGSDPSGGSIYYFNPDKTSNKWIRTRPVIKRIGQPPLLQLTPHKNRPATSCRAVSFLYI